MPINEFPLPKGARPRRIAIGSDYMVWYTNYQRGYLGRLDPQTGKIAEWPTPGGRNAVPYGIATLKDGTIWYSESGVKPNTIIRFDPRTKRFSAWQVLRAAGRYANIVATPDGNI